MTAAPKLQAQNDGPEGGPLLDPGHIGAGRFLEQKPPARRWLLQDLLPLGVVGLLAAGGGTGKSFLTLELAIAVTTGRPLLGMEVGEPGGVLMLAAEDEQEELHRRLWGIVESMKAGGELDAEDLDMMKKRLFIASMVGEDNRLIHNVDGQIVRAPTGKRIKATMNELPVINLIVLDPVSRFRDGDENDNAAATRFVEAVETLRADTGATVLLPHHVSKQGLQAGTEALSVEALRGATALVDGVRWAAAMAPLGKDAASKYGVAQEEAGHYVRLDAVKNNYAPPWGGLWLKRGPGGVLVPTTLTRKQDGNQKKRAEDRYERVLPLLADKVAEHERRGDPLTKSRLREFAGQDGIFGIGDQSLRSILRRAIDEGAIIEHKAQGPGSYLGVPSGGVGWSGDG